MAGLVKESDRGSVIFRLNARHYADVFVSRDVVIGVFMSGHPSATPSGNSQCYVAMVTRTKITNFGIK